MGLANPSCRARAVRSRSGPTGLPSRRRYRSGSRPCQRRTCRYRPALPTSQRPPIRPRCRCSTNLVQTPLPAPKSTRPRGPNVLHSFAWVSPCSVQSARSRTSRLPAGGSAPQERCSCGDACAWRWSIRAEHSCAPHVFLPEQSEWRWNMSDPHNDPTRDAADSDGSQRRFRPLRRPDMEPRGPDRRRGRAGDIRVLAHQLRSEGGVQSAPSSHHERARAANGARESRNPAPAQQP